jgi:gliding motility-associated-like protein
MNATVTTENHVALIWRSAPIFNAALYQILRKDAITGDYLRIAQVSATDTTFVDETAQADKKSYSYKIRVIDACGNSNDLSNEATSIFVQMETKEFQVSLNWNQYNEWKNGVQYYIIDRLNPTTGQFDSIATVRGTSYTEDPSHLNLANYVYRVRGIEQSGNQMVSVSNIVKNTLKPTLYIPTAFTPNGDQLNDQFKVVGMHIKEIEIEIYNRWGEMIFHTNNINDGWDGTFKGADAMQDSYVFKVRATAENGETFLKSGVVSLVRNNQ